MGVNTAERSRARIPYGTWGSSYFPAWQTSPWPRSTSASSPARRWPGSWACARCPQDRARLPGHRLDDPWHWKFWNAPLVASCMGHRIPGYHVEQACATGLQAVVAGGRRGRERSARRGRRADLRPHERLAGRRVPRAARATSARRPIADVWDNFGFDPATGKAMIATAGMAARKYKIDRREVDELAALPLRAVLRGQGLRASSTACSCRSTCSTSRGEPLGRIDDDLGVRKVDARRPARACASSTPASPAGTQTHASDGMATLLVTDRGARDGAQPAARDRHPVRRQDRGADRSRA